MDALRYRVGIDVGSYSVGLAAVEIDENGSPVKLLSCLSHIHDAGLDPQGIKSATTRLASSGVARRTRRLFKKRRRRLIALDRFIESLGWPLVDLESLSDPLAPWRYRAMLASTKIDDNLEREKMLSVALRHIARHRGWRNPYTTARSVGQETSHSEAYGAVRKEIEDLTGLQFPSDATVAELIIAGYGKTPKLRGEGGILSARLHQCDHALEIRKICQRQGIEDETYRNIIEAVFLAESPKGSAAGRTGPDPLQPSRRRALKASAPFQRYRILALTGNLRIRESDGPRRLDEDERLVVVNFLLNYTGKEFPTWIQIAEKLGIDRGRLLGTATVTDDGERAGSRPPVNDTTRSILNSKIRPLVEWWKLADDDSRSAMVIALCNGEISNFDSPAGAKVQAFFAELADEEHAKLDALHLPIGRAAYSEDTLARLSDRMTSDNVDLHDARLIEFGVAQDWSPPAPAIGEAVGNPAVDRVLKTVARFLNAAELRWGPPASVNIEHVRAAFVSESSAREMDRDNNRRATRNKELFESMQKTLGVQGRVHRSDLWRYQSVQRQNGQCAYCGQPIAYSSSEMDHIVPRAGMGSTNTRENLVAVCHRCNLSKGRVPFAVWASKSEISGVSVEEAIDRTRHWNVDSGLTSKQFNDFRFAVRTRLKRESVDEEIDARSLESVAWMANELRSRISQAFSANATQVRVYKGALTAEARRASGITDKLVFIGGTGKSRLDRRHHAVDAAVISMMSHFVAETLAIRSNLKVDQQLRQLAPQWKAFTGSDPAHRSEWNSWIGKMQTLANLLSEALENDRIVVTSNLRLRLGNGAVHEDTIRSFREKGEPPVLVGDEMGVDLINRASTEALWCALTRQPDFDAKKGLPKNPDRKIRVRDRHLVASDSIDFFPVPAASIAVRGGYAELGATFHHARIFKINGKKPSFAMMRVYTSDLQRFKSVDLFSIDLPPQTMSRRKCEPKLRDAMQEGTAEYLGWLVVDDELLVDTSRISTGQVSSAQNEVGVIKRWRVDGFYSDARFRLRPLHLSAEGLTRDAGADLRKVVDKPGWLPAVNKLFSDGSVTVIRRDALGNVRIGSRSHLPIAWKIG